MAQTRRDSGRRNGLTGWLSGLFGPREIDKLVDENFPSWQEFSSEKLRAAAEQREASERIELPPHKVSVSSPLQRNILYVLVVTGLIGLGYAQREWAPVLIYGTILAAFTVALLAIIRDGVFLHLEGQRLAVDGHMINKHTHGPEPEREQARFGGFLRALGRRRKNHNVFRSKLLQIHYQNVLRTFEQGNRRAWVYQDASISEIATLLSQRGMKLAWTIIEVLPQLGLIGTLIGLITMFFAFDAGAANPEVAILAGFGTALGTTVLANLFVLVLRPLYMQNERSMNEVLSTLQALMAIFILPTQQYAMDRGGLRTGTGTAAASTGTALAPMAAAGEARLNRNLEELADTLRDFVAVQEQVDSGAMARETAQVAQEVQNALRGFQQAVDPEPLADQQRALQALSRSVEGLSQQLSQMEGGGGWQAGGSPRIEHDLTQLRVLTRDTLMLLQHISHQLRDNGGAPQRLLSTQPGVREQVFPDTMELETEAERAGRDAEPSRERLAPRVRLARERR